MASQKEKQGFLGDLSAKSKDELLYLLNRQEQLLSNKKFISHLPDKGSKIGAFLTKLKTALRQLEDIDFTADEFQRLSLKSERARHRGWDSTDKSEEERVIERILQHREQEKVVVDERTSKSDEREQEEIVIDETTPTLDEGKQKNCEKNEEKVTSSGKKAHKSKFKPNRTLRTTHKDDNLSSQFKDVSIDKDIVTLEHVEEDAMDTIRLGHTNLENDSEFSSISDSVTKSVATRFEFADCDTRGGVLKHRYDEALEEASISSRAKCTTAELISFEDSIEIMKMQQQKLKEVQEKHAFEKLGERLNVNMSAFHPEKSSFASYRDIEGGTEEESDLDEDDLEYPD